MTKKKKPEDKLPMGCPPHFESPEDMQKAIEEYFTNPPIKTVNSKDGTIEIPFISITGLCLELGFCSRQSFYDYEKRPNFSYIIKRARTLIENEYELMLKGGNTTGAIFALKQFGWTDKHEVENTNIEVTHEEWLKSLK